VQVLYITSTKINCWVISNVLNNVFKNKIIPLVQIFTQLEQCLISSHLTFAQIYKLYVHGKYRMNGSVINVLANVNQIQLILPHDGMLKQ
jgi:hypothetical protein